MAVLFSSVRNVVHGSDSPANGEREIGKFVRPFRLFSPQKCSSIKNPLPSVLQIVLYDVENREFCWILIYVRTVCSSVV